MVFGFTKGTMWASSSTGKRKQVSVGVDAHIDPPHAEFGKFNRHEIKKTLTNYYVSGIIYIEKGSLLEQLAKFYEN